MASAMPRFAPCLTVLAGTVTGLAFRHVTPIADPALARLVLFMVVLKAALVLGLAVSASLRLRRPGPAVRYAVATGLAALGPALISGISHAGLGAGCFYAGLALFAATAWLDRAGWVYAARAISIRSSRGASPIAHTSVPPRGTSVQNAPSSIGSLTNSNPVGVGR